MQNRAILALIFWGSLICSMAAKTSGDPPYWTRPHAAGEGLCTSCIVQAELDYEELRYIPGLGLRKFSRFGAARWDWWQFKDVTRAVGDRSLGVDSLLYPLMWALFEGTHQDISPMNENPESKFEPISRHPEARFEPIRHFSDYEVDDSNFGEDGFNFFNRD
jgi:hypothetical protein